MHPHSAWLYVVIASDFPGGEDVGSRSEGTVALASGKTTHFLRNPGVLGG
jgi:hypothetical protein